MPERYMSTVKQKLALEKVIENRGNISRSMREVGYAPSTAKNPSNLTSSKGWNELLRVVIDDQTLVQRIYEIAQQDDKRAALQAIDMLLKLKDRYPAGTIKIQQYDSELMEITEEQP